MPLSPAQKDVSFLSRFFNCPARRPALAWLLFVGADSHPELTPSNPTNPGNPPTHPPTHPKNKQDPLDRGTRAHSELANVLRLSSVASRASRNSELRVRSSVTMRRRSSALDKAAAAAVAERGEDKFGAVEEVPNMRVGSAVRKFQGGKK